MFDVFKQMINTITRDFGCMPVEFGVIRVSRLANSHRFASSGFVWLALLTDVSWKGLCKGLSR